MRSTVQLLLLYPSALFAQSNQPAFVPCVPYGGQAAVDLLFERELIFPEDALQEGIDGISTLIFTVDADGSVRDLRVWQPLSPSCDAEALRLAKLIRWHAATLAGEARAAEHYLKVPFDPKQYKRWLKIRSHLCATIKDGEADVSGKIHSRAEVDSLPRPLIPNGIKGLPKYLGDNLRYPPDAFKRDLQGLVRIEFVVEPSGSLSNMRALDELGGGCTEEAIRLINAACWRPAIKDGKRVRGTMEVSINFRIAQNEH